MKEIYDPVLKEPICCGNGDVFGVESVCAFKNYTMSLRFSNGEQRIFDARKLLEAPVFRPLEKM